jgi:hypothetical protein
MPMTRRKPGADSVLAELVSSLIEEDVPRAEIAAYVSGIGYRHYGNDMSVQTSQTVGAAVHEFLETGERGIAAAVIREQYDSESVIMDLAQYVNQSEFLADFAFRAHHALTMRHAGLMEGRSVAAVTSRLLGHIVDLAAKLDPSDPLDVFGDDKVTLCFVPGSSADIPFEEITTRSWAQPSTAYSVFPNEPFLEFLRFAGISKADWLEAALDNSTVDDIEAVEAVEGERELAWSSIDEWTCSARIGLTPDDVASAVAACPYGFTPLVAFQMSASAIVDIDFSKGLEITGGIIGLHHFKTGTGDPLRFEGTVRIFPKLGELHVASASPTGLAAVHGFDHRSFSSSVSPVDPVPAHEPLGMDPRP